MKKFKFHIYRIVLVAFFLTSVAIKEVVSLKLDKEVARFNDLDRIQSSSFGALLSFSALFQGVLASFSEYPLKYTATIILTSWALLLAHAKYNLRSAYRFSAHSIFYISLSALLYYFSGINIRPHFLEDYRAAVKTKLQRVDILAHIASSDILVDPENSSYFSEASLYENILQAFSDLEALYKLAMEMYEWRSGVPRLFHARLTADAEGPARATACHLLLGIIIGKVRQESASNFTVFSLSQLKVIYEGLNEALSKLVYFTFTDDWQDPIYDWIKYVKNLVYTEIERRT